MVDTILKKQPTKKNPILPVSTQEQSDSGYEELSLINTDATFGLAGSKYGLIGLYCMYVWLQLIVAPLWWN